MLTVSHHRGSYAVDFVTIDDVAGKLPDGSVVLTDQNVATHYGRLFEAYPSIVVPAGEGSKQLAQFEQVVTRLAETGAIRSTTLVALGGGVVGDLGGFVAATYMRGIGLVQVPTTLLAQVDSSVGGKVGIDLPVGKNLVGAFQPPSAVYVATDALQTLPQREFAAGMAEVCKYGFIMDAALVNDLSDRCATVDDIGPIVERCVRHKAAVVAEDEFETKGLRAILNFGHTVGHAIELATGYGPVLHGEAIGVGMRVEAALAERLGIAQKGLERDIVQCLERQRIRTHLKMRLDSQRLVEAMRKDKKRSGKGLPFSLVTSIGNCKLFTDVPESEIEPLLDDL